ncbi:MAG TPA: polysaccharide biosynthesis/export family protein [Candidatus Hypogeohydataceae bacterium YC41]
MRKTNLAVNFFLLVLLSFFGCTSTQKFSKIPTSIPDNVQNRFEYLNNTYKIGPPDEVLVRVRDNPDLDTQAIVRPDGNISFPLLGDIYIADLTPSEVREKLWKSLGSYIRELPLEAVQVQVVGFNSKKIYIYSESMGIKEIPYTGGTTLLDAIAQSGLLGFTSTMKDIKVVRAANHNHSDDETTAPQMLVVDLGEIIKEGNHEKNIFLKENDIVCIPTKLLAKMGFAIGSLLMPMQPARGVGSFVESARVNNLGLFGPMGAAGGSRFIYPGTNVYNPTGP